MTEKEKFELWFADQKEKGLINFKPYFNLAGIAEHFGAKVVWQEIELWPGAMIPCEVIDWTGVEATHEERIEYMYKVTNNFIEAAKDAKPFNFHDSHDPNWVCDLPDCSNCVTDEG